ncbi:putative signal peptide protein [Puccinia sorghi]|uniref:Putative signal peptide protein n=1 Tax=Puccinia sorghi TaxID=27349 RepID=A0A0L6U7Y0_9BASI|nr:putative signal peptide protein [Puccinia sorghi]
MKFCFCCYNFLLVIHSLSLVVEAFTQSEQAVISLILTICKVIVPTISKERSWRPPPSEMVLHHHHSQDKQQSVRRWIDSTRTSQLSGELEQALTNEPPSPTHPAGTHEPAQTIHSESTLEYLDKPLSENDTQHPSLPPPCSKSSQSNQDASSHHTPTNKQSHRVQPRLSSQKLPNAPHVPPAKTTAPVEHHWKDPFGFMEQRAGPCERTTESGMTADNPTPEIQQPQGPKETHQHHSSDLSLADLLNLRKKPPKQTRKKFAASKTLSTATTRNPAHPPVSHPTRLLRRNNSSCMPPPAKPPPVSGTGRQFARALVPPGHWLLGSLDVPRSSRDDVAARPVGRCSSRKTTSCVAPPTSPAPALLLPHTRALPQTRILPPSYAPPPPRPALSLLYHSHTHTLSLSDFCLLSPTRRPIGRRDSATTELSTPSSSRKKSSSICDALSLFFCESFIFHIQTIREMSFSLGPLRTLLLLLGYTCSLLHPVSCSVSPGQKFTTAPHNAAPFLAHSMLYSPSLFLSCVRTPRQQKQTNWHNILCGFLFFVAVLLYLLCTYIHAIHLLVLTHISYTYHTSPYFLFPFTLPST